MHTRLHSKRFVLPEEGIFMDKIKVGVMVESFRLGLKSGIEKAREIGAQGIQIFATKGEATPDNLSRSERRGLKDFVSSRGLEISALCGDLGGHGFENADDNNWKVDKTKEIMELACDLGTNVVTTHIGVIPRDPEEQIYKNIYEALDVLGRYGEKIGIYIAIETGPESSKELRDFLDKLHNDYVKVNFDPANLVMVTGDDPVEGVKELAPYIIHTHAKDGVRIKAISPRIIYNYFAEGGIEDLRLSDYFVEKPLGEGDVDFPKYLSTLRDIGYRGFFTIERETGKNPVEDIEKAVIFLRNLQKKVFSES